MSIRRSASIFCSPSPEPASAGPHILLVDDNEQNLELLEAYLDDLHGTTQTAPDGLEALKAIERRRPDLILLDVMMPRMSGFQLCKRLKADPATKSIKIIMVTALNEVSDMERAADVGADAFLTKPVNRQELLDRIKSCLAS
jgi:two-component system cell cycle response regulator